MEIIKLYNEKLPIMDKNTVRPLGGKFHVNISSDLNFNRFEFSLQSIRESLFCKLVFKL